MGFDDLRDLGVSSVGHRRKLLKAVEALSLGRAAPRLAAAGPPAASTGAER